MNQRVELLAPAGNPEGFYGAIHAGADAVYLAGNRFGARAYADNFTTEELVACIRYAHILGRKVYLTVNTLVKETEFPELAPYLTPFYQAGLDGVIVQDIGVFCFIREHFPQMELHVSTQMTLTSKYGAGLLKKLGAVRVVPARELSLAELVEMKEQTGLEIETFIHGAMCYCYSGQCLFSSILGGRSGNRGRCAQPCRLPYKVEGNRSNSECFPLSLKDMCTIEHIPELIAAGIDSFKIEGRMKKPEYAAGVTAIYRKYIDRYYEGKNCKVAPADLNALARLYIRSERQDGYYYRHNGKDMVTLDSPSYSGADDDLLESIKTRYLDTRPQLIICMNVDFHIDVPARIEIYLASDPSVSVEITGDVVSSAMKQPITEENIQKQFRKLGDTLFTAEKINISLDSNAFYPLKAMNELRRRAVEALENLLIEKNGLCTGRTLPESISASKTDRINNNCYKTESNLHVLIRTPEQLNALVTCINDVDMNAAGTTPNIPVPRRIYLEADCIYDALKYSDHPIFDQCLFLYSKGCMPIIALPPIIRKRDEEFLLKIWEIYCTYKAFDNAALFQGFLVRSMDGMGFLESKIDSNNQLPAIYGDAGFYIWNRESMSTFGNNALKQDTSVKLTGFCMPYELKASEHRQLLASQKSAALQIEKVIYGRIPLMQTANCIVNTVSGCDKNGSNKITYLTDRYKKRFPVLRNCIHCMNTIYNSVPLSLHGEQAKWYGQVDFRLDFTIEDGQETGRILQYFMTGLAKGELYGNVPFREYTTGHEKRGVE